ncbi:hypothetical protein H0H87_005576 [Tephrocybe sp. NHM501043]|nr:hypothetical protein H0H87_005576 [Tephrocybe sp. NHM501043]
MAINYAKSLGIESVAGPVVFAIAYAPLLVWFIIQAIRRPTFVFVYMSLFCLIRISAFVIRSILAGSESAGETIEVYIADQVLFGVGYFGLLYSAYTLVLDRWQLTKGPSDQGIMRLMQNRRLFRIVMLAAVILGIIGATEANSTDPKNGKTFKIDFKRYGWPSLNVRLDPNYRQYEMKLTTSAEKAGFKTSGAGTIGGEHSSYILCAIALLLFVREVFVTATLNDAAKQNNEHFWYPLYAVPEILAVILYATPGLVPPRSELQAQSSTTQMEPAYDFRPNVV